MTDLRASTEHAAPLPPTAGGDGPDADASTVPNRLESVPAPVEPARAEVAPVAVVSVDPRDVPVRRLGADGKAPYRPERPSGRRAKPRAPWPAPPAAVQRDVEAPRERSAEPPAASNRAHTNGAVTNGAHARSMAAPALGSVPALDSANAPLSRVRKRPIAPPEPYIPPELPGTEEDLRSHSRNRVLLEWMAVLGGAFVFALLIKVALFQAFVIPTESMVPELNVGDRVLVLKFSVDVDELERGDIIVFERPPGAVDPNDDSDLIKRVIGLPGEMVEGRGNAIYVDGVAIDESWLDEGSFTKDFGPVSLQANELWMMGDNRFNSRDSTVFGPVSGDLIVGKALVRVWPVSRFDTL